MKKSFFIDEQGKRFSLENSNHIRLAHYIIENDKNLKDEFFQSGKKSSIEFLMRNKKYIAGVEDTEKERREITFDSKIISICQRKWIDYYQKKGYILLDLFELRNKMQNRNLDRGED